MADVHECYLLDVCIMARIPHPPDAPMKEHEDVKTTKTKIVSEEKMLVGGATTREDVIP